MPSFSDIIKQSGKGLDSSKDLIYLLSINIGGTSGINANGTASYANLGKDVEGDFYKAKLQDTGMISRSVQPENGQFEVSDLAVTLSNNDLEFSKWPWNTSILNRPAILSMGFSGSDSLEYLADSTYYANATITASGGPLGIGSPGDISISIAYTLYKGIIKSEERNNKGFRLSIGDYTHKIFKDIPPRILKVDEFPRVGTSISGWWGTGAQGTKLPTMVDLDTSLVGKKLPYIYGDFSNTRIKPLFIDTLKNRYLIADHAIGSITKVISGGTQVYNFTYPTIGGKVGGTHLTGTNIMSFFSFGTSQGTRNVYVSVTGRHDSDDNLLQNPALVLKDILLSSSLCGLSASDISTSTFDVAEEFLNPYNFRYIMDGEIHENSIDLIQNLSVCSMSSFYFNKENQANFDVYRPAMSRTYIRKIQQHEVIEDSFSFSKDIRDVYNRLLVNYDYDWIEQKYRNAYEEIADTYTNQFDTVRTFVIDAPFVYTSTEASYVGKRWLNKLQAGLGRVNFSVPISALPLDIGERIELSHDEPPTPDGGWTNRLLNITEFEIDNRGKTINISAIDEEETTKKYFILGDNTGGFYTTASESQRYYGALCGASGLFSNGDEGYRLW